MRGTSTRNEGRVNVARGGRRRGVIEVGGMGGEGETHQR